METTWRPDSDFDESATRRTELAPPELNTISEMSTAESRDVISAN
jgi:hypothetical protein